MPTPRIVKMKCTNPSCWKGYHYVVVDEECYSRPCLAHRQCPDRDQGCDMLVMCEGDVCDYGGVFCDEEHYFCGAAFLRVMEGGPDEGSQYCIHCYEMYKIDMQSMGLWKDEWASASDKEEDNG